MESKHFQKEHRLYSSIHDSEEEVVGVECCIHNEEFTEFEL